MGGSRGGGRNTELEELQRRALEDELEEKERLESDLEARRRTRMFGGRRGQLRFLGPLARQVRRTEERGQQAVTPATPSAAAAPTGAGRQPRETFSRTGRTGGTREAFSSRRERIGGSGGQNFGGGDAGARESADTLN